MSQNCDRSPNDTIREDNSVHQASQADYKVIIHFCL